MKSFIRVSFILASFILLTSSVASAQVSDRLMFTAPFPFVAAGTLLPAGEYTIAPISDAPALITLSGTHGSLLLMEVDQLMPSMAALEHGVPNELVFRKLKDGTYALSEVWETGDQHGVQSAWEALNGGRAVTAAQGDVVRVPGVTK